VESAPQAVKIILSAVIGASLALVFQLLIRRNENKANNTTLTKNISFMEKTSNIQKPASQIRSSKKKEPKVITSDKRDHRMNTPQKNREHAPAKEEQAQDKPVDQIQNQQMKKPDAQKKVVNEDEQKQVVNNPSAKEPAEDEDQN
jgi:hypothetical protein